MYHLDVFAQPKVGEFEMCSRTPRQMHQQHTIDTFPVLIEHNHICEVSVGSIFTDLLQSIALSNQVESKLVLTLTMTRGN